MRCHLSYHDSVKTLFIYFLRLAAVLGSDEALEKTFVSTLVGMVDIGIKGVTVTLSYNLPMQNILVYGSKK